MDVGARAVLRLVRVLLVPVLLSGLGVSAAVVGSEDDAPGLVGIGCLLVLGAVLLGYRAGRRSG